MAGIKTTGPILEGNPGPSPLPGSGKTGKPDAKSVLESLNLTFNLTLFSPVKSPNWRSIDIIAVHGSEDVNSTWTWRKGNKDTTPRNPTGSARPDGAPPRNPASKQGESNATMPEKNPASKQGGFNAAVPEESPASKQGKSNTAVLEESPASEQGKSITAVLEESPASKQGESDAIVPKGGASKSNLSAETVPQTNYKPREPDEKALGTSVPPEASVPQPGKTEEITPKAKGPQSNISGEKAKRGLPFSNPFMPGSSKKPESKSTKPESPATSAPPKGTITQPVANDQRGKPREPEEVNWLKDSKMLPSALPDCPVLGFRYPITFPPNTPARGVLDFFAEKFLEAIKKRWKGDSHGRKAPIIFIGDELGGLIIEKALSIVGTWPEEERKLLLPLIAAVIFLATPFPDSGSKEGVGNQLTSKVLDLVRGGHRPIPVHEVVDELMNDTTELRQLFDGLVKTNHIPVVRFNSKSPDSDQSKSKTKDAGSKNIELDKTTKGICKSPSRTDGDYRNVYTTLREFVNKRHMHDAVLEKVEYVTSLLEEGVNVELQDELGQTPLQIAVMNRRPDIARLLLGRGAANIDHQDNKGFTALHHAVMAAKREDDSEAVKLIQLLLRKNADAGMADKDGKTAWQLEGTPQWVLDLKKHRALIEGVSKSATADLEMPKAPQRKEAVTACRGFSATMMEFYYDDKEEYLIENASIEELIYDPNPERGPDHILSLARQKDIKKTFRCRWYHIPANNETWAQDLFAKLGIRVDPMNEHRHEGNALHSRFMRPQFKKTKLGKQKPDETGSGMMLYIPFLSFETSSSIKQMTEIMRQARPTQSMYASRNTEAPKLDQHDDENLIKGYCESLHPRRTLDQFYYYMLEDTKTRDESQVISRADIQHQTHGSPGLGMQKAPSETYVMMADQLWLWITNDGTVVTSFAEPWGESRESDSFNVLRKFIKYIESKDRSPVTSGHDLATKIVRHCLNAYNTCNPPGLKVHDVFEAAINSAADHETKLFEKFLEDSENLLRASKKPTIVGTAGTAGTAGITGTTDTTGTTGITLIQSRG